MNDYEYMLLALEEAKKAYDEGEVPVGAVIVKDDNVIAKAYNTKEKNKCSLDHAELSAIKFACGKLDNWRLIDAELSTIKLACGKLDNWRLIGTTIYVTLEPCPMCASAIKQSRINRVVYLLDNNDINTSKIVNEIFSLHDANAPVEKVKLDISKFNEEDIMILSDFFRKRRY